ncbi:uncharacterized protein LOC122644976 [Telopea speciosissima]|uniref:uncharacterized protein LOC122644976 n=1 Tax=Telopea speciosissima TaxID=54955 RepID=UPI001CC65D11|nr:uncharacterized protein LOC122644976 [Telopea speciosissima]
MEVPLIGLTPWKLFFDGSKTEQAAGAGVVLRSPEGTETQVAFRLDFSCSNNQAEYEALVLGMGLLLGLKADAVEIIGDSQLVIKQLAETITCDNGSVFTANEIVAFAAKLGRTFTHSTPYYAQGNGKAEASNKILKGCLAKVVDDNPRRWADMLSEVLWAFRTSQRTSTATTPFALTYGHDAVLVVEISVKSARVAYQQGLTPTDYSEAMLAELDDLDEEWLAALDKMQVQKKKVAAIYNKRISLKHFQEGDIVLKAVLPVGARDPSMGKWSPMWEGPYTVCQVLRRGAYRLQDLKGNIQVRPINNKFLKTFHPTIWDLG